MKLSNTLPILLVLTLFALVPVQNSYSGDPMIDQNTTEDAEDLLVYFFDLRDRESFIQVTNVNSAAQVVHVQIFNVADNCNENDFFDTLTGNDTHTYNMRDILTNDGNPSGVVLPEGAYGIVSILTINSAGMNSDEDNFLIGNFRILDNNGYEYRTNAQAEDDNSTPIPGPSLTATFNYNTSGNVTLSDVIGITARDNNSIGELEVDILENFAVMDVDIYNDAEVPFSCRDITFACVDDDNPLLDALLEETGTAVASFEYGINNAIPHSKGGELLCPGNTISDGLVRFRIDTSQMFIDDFYGYVGLNNGNGRGSMDSIWTENVPEVFDP